MKINPVKLHSKFACFSGAGLPGLRLAVDQKIANPLGVHVMNAQRTLKRVADGMQFLAVGSDVRMMTQNANDLLETFRPEPSMKDITRDLLCRKHLVIADQETIFARQAHIQSASPISNMLLPK